MGQMADGRRHIIVLPVVQNQRNGAHGLYQRGIAFQLPAGDIPGGGQDIICLLYTSCDSGDGCLYR